MQPAFGLDVSRATSVGDDIDHSAATYAVPTGVLQCVAVCCSVLQCVAVCCSVLQCVVVFCSSVLQCVSVEKNVAVYCSVIIAVCCSGDDRPCPQGQTCYCSVLQCVAVHFCVFYSVLQRVAACCSVLQRVAACCSVLQWR